MSDQKPKPRKPAVRAKKVAEKDPAPSEAVTSLGAAKARSRSKPKAVAAAAPAPAAPDEAGGAADKRRKPGTSPRGGGRRRGSRGAAAMRQARFAVGDVVRHRFYPFRGVVFDIDPVFANTEEWWLAIPEEIRPAKDQPFYHLLAENAETEYVAYVSEQNLIADQTGKPLRHPKIAEMFELDDDGSYRAVFINRH